MQLNKNSLSYMFMSKGWITSDESIPTNLCPYVRRFLADILRTAFGFTLLLGLLVGIAAAAATPILLLFGAMFSVGWLIISSLIWAAAIWVTVWYFIEEKVPWETKQKVSNSLPVKYAKAVHDKVCPNIEFVE